MIKITVLVSLFSALASAAQEFVETLNNENFDNFVKSNSNTPSLIEFYAPWCGHCKNLAPEYERAAEFLGKKNVKLAKVDCDSEKALCEKHGIKGFPTLKVLQDGQFNDYQGPRDSVGIVNYMEVFLRPLLTTVTSQNVNEFANEYNIATLAFLKNDDCIEHRLFQDLAKKFRSKNVFGFTTDAVVAKKFGLNNVNELVLLKKFDDPQTKFTGRFGTTEIEQFLTKESIRTMDEIDASNYKTYMDMKLPLCYFFYTSPTDRQSIGSQIEAVAKQYRGKVNFVYIDSNKFGSHANNLNLEAKFPAFVIHDINSDLKYPFSETLNQENVSKFVKNFSENKLTPFFKSEPVPASNNGPVKIVVGSEYEKIVLDKSKDVLLKLYAPWCGHCKSLAPIFEELGKKFEGSDKVVIAKMDLTANNLPKAAGYSVQGYPTLKLIKANTNEVVDFTGDRTLEAMTDFIIKNGNNNVQLSKEHEEL